MPLPANFHSTVEDVLKAYPRTLVTVTCENRSGEFLGGHWAVYPPSPADYFVKCLCGCADVYTVSSFEKHCGRGASKKWRETLRVQEGGNKKSLGAWIEDGCNAADAGLPEEGCRVIVYWPGAEGEKWHHGQVKDVDDHGRSTIAYDDEDREVLHFAMERFKFEEGTPPSVLAIKHESMASPASSAIDLCSSSSDLDEVQLPSLLLEDSPKQAAAALQPAAPNRQQPPMAQQVGTSASAVTLPSAPHGQSADQPFRQASQAAHTVHSVAHRHHQPSSQDQANVAHAQMLGRAPLHGPRLPERPQKRKRAAIESGADLGQTQAVRKPPALGGKHRSAGSVPAGQTHPQAPDCSHTANPVQQRLTAPANQCKTRQPLRASPTKVASPTEVKLRHSPSQPSRFDLHGVSRATGRQSPAAALLPHEDNLFTQTSAAHAEPDHHQLAEAELTVRAEASAPMTELQQVLSLFGADTVGLAAKESALTQLVMLVADSMTVASFLGHMDKARGPKESDRLARYYQSICRLVQKAPGTEKVEDVLGMYFKTLCSGHT